MFFIAIAGGSGSGKTTFTEKILQFVQSNDVVHLYQDSYYLKSQSKDNYIKNKPNFDHPDAFDWDLMRLHIQKLRNGESIECPVYDYHQSTRDSETTTIHPPKVCLFDGIYTLWDPIIRSLFDLKIYLHVDADIRFIRRLHRDVRERGRSLDSIISQYYDTVRPMHKQYLEPTKQYADLIIGEETDIPAEVIGSKILSVISSNQSTKL